MKFVIFLTTAELDNSKIEASGFNEDSWKQTRKIQIKRLYQQCVQHFTVSVHVTPATPPPITIKLNDMILVSDNENFWNTIWDSGTRHQLIKYSHI